MGRFDERCNDACALRAPRRSILSNFTHSLPQTVLKIDVARRRIVHGGPRVRSQNHLR